MSRVAAAVTAAAGGAEALGLRLPAWSVVPFGLMLLSIAVLPLSAPRFWERNRNKALVSLVLGAPVALWVGLLDPAAVLHTAHEYVAFVVLLGALFVISGGIVVRGTLAGTPGLNAILLAIGAVLASLIGTTGASMVLIRPLLRANSVRQDKAHIFVFFIFVVANAGGLLTPLGDPPLFLGFLRGVPFLWTLRLFPIWLLVNGALVLLFFIVDSTMFRREDLATPGDLDEVAIAHQVPSTWRAGSTSPGSAAWWPCSSRRGRSTCRRGCRRRGCSSWSASPGRRRRGRSATRTGSGSPPSSRSRRSSPGSSRR